MPSKDKEDGIQDEIYFIMVWTYYFLSSNCVKHYYVISMHMGEQ